MASPLHCLPPCVGMGLLQFRVWAPPPHDTLHDDHDDQPPLTMCQGHVKIIKFTQPTGAYECKRVSQIDKLWLDIHTNHVTPMRTDNSNRLHQTYSGLQDNNSQNKVFRYFRKTTPTHTHPYYMTQPHSTTRTALDDTQPSNFISSKQNNTQINLRLTRSKI